MNRKPKLETDPGRDPQRRAHQAQVKYAILENQAWGLTYLLARVKDRAPYSNYSVPDDLEVFEFTVKGVVRLEMMAQEGYKSWRRMFGSNTKAKEISTWRSRASINAFTNLEKACAYVKADPLWSWSESPFSWPEGYPSDDWYVLFQVQDVWLPEERCYWADLLETFLEKDSALLKLVDRYDVLPSAKSEKGGNDA
jgi:hypothetical protein